MNIYCFCLHKVNKLVKIQNESRDLFPNVNKANMYADSEYDTFKSVINMKVTKYQKSRIN